MLNYSNRLSYLRSALASGRFGRIVLLGALLFGLLTVNVAGLAQAPSTYSAYTGTDPKTIPPAPALGPANSVITDPTFGSRILRVTDLNTRGGESFVSTDSGFHRSWNADSTAIKLTGPHGDSYWMSFNLSLFQVGDGSSRPAVYAVPFGASWEWSTVDPDIIYFLRGSNIAKYNKSTGVTTNLAATPNGHPVTYMAVVVGQDNWVCAAAGAGAQNSYTEIFCVNPTSPNTTKFIDVLARTINGVVSGDPNWPRSGSSTIGIHDISGGTGGSWLEVTFHNSSWGGNGGAALNLATNTWSTYGSADIYWGGHVSMGNGKYANSAGSRDGRDSRGILLRNPDSLSDSSQYQFVSQPTGASNNWCDADHNSWLNSMSNPNAPILVSRYFSNASNCAFAWTGEIDAAAVDGSNTVWRFAHNHTGGCYYGEGFAQISNDGNWALFSSYWEGTLGSDTSFGCSTRIDTFIVQLSGSGTSDPPPTITTSSLSSGTQGSAYNATLSATGGTTPYTWSLPSGSLPAGLSLSSSGVISGTPIATGTSSFTVQVTDARSQSATASLSIRIDSSTSGTITLVQSAQTEGTATSSLSVGFPSNNLPGDLIIASVRMSTAYQTVSVTDSLGNTYVDAVSQSQNSDGHQVHIFYAKNTAGGANTVTASFSGTNNHPWIAVYEYSGADTSNPVDQIGKAQGSGSSPSVSSSGPTSSDRQLVFAAMGLPASYQGTASAGAGYSMMLQGANTSRAASETANLSAAQAVTSGFTLTSPASWSAVVATFKAKGTSSPPPLTITTTSFPGGTQNAPYSAVLSATGGTTPYAWSILSGSLPLGLTLNSASGIISGTPTGSGTAAFTVQVVDANSQQATAPLSIAIAPAGGPDPIAMVQSNASEGSAVPSLSVGFGSNINGGNLIVAVVRMSSASQTVSITDTLGNVYTRAVSQVQSSDGHQLHIFYAKNVAGGTNTVTASFSSVNNHPWIAVYEFSGLSRTNPLDQTAHSQGYGSAPNSGPTATTSSANELVMSAIGMPASFTGSVAAGNGYAMGQQDAGTSRAASQTAVSTATGSFAGTAGLSYGTSWSSVVATFRQ